MSGFVATSGKYEVFAPGSDTYVMFNDSNDVNAVSGLTFTKGTATLSSTVLQTPTLQGDGTADLTIKTDGGNYGIILDSEDDTIEIKLSGVQSAVFSGTGLNIVSGDTYSIAGTSVVSATGAALVQPAAITGRTELGDGAVAGAVDMLVIADASDSFALKKVTPDNLGITGGSGGEDVLQRALRNVGLVEVDAS